MSETLPPEERDTLPPEPTPVWARDLGIQMDAIHTMMGKLLHAVLALTNATTETQADIEALKYRVGKLEIRLDNLDRVSDGGE